MGKFKFVLLYWCFVDLFFCLKDLKIVLCLCLGILILLLEMVIVIFLLILINFVEILIKLEFVNLIVFFIKLCRICWRWFLFVFIGGKFDGIVLISCKFFFFKIIWEKVRIILVIFCIFIECICSLMLWCCSLEKLRILLIKLVKWCLLLIIIDRFFFCNFEIGLVVLFFMEFVILIILLRGVCSLWDVFVKNLFLSWFNFCNFWFFIFRLLNDFVNCFVILLKDLVKIINFLIFWIDIFWFSFLLVIVLVVVDKFLIGLVIYCIINSFKFKVIVKVRIYSWIVDLVFLFIFFINLYLGMIIIVN